MTSIAIATDSLGQTTVSAAVSVTVTGPSGLPVVSVASIKHQFTLNFARAGRDSISFAVTSTADLGYQDKNAFLTATNGTQITVFVGDVLLDSASLKNGKGVGAGMVRWNCRKGEIRYQARNMDLRALLAPYGATNESTSVKVSLPLYVGWNGTSYGGSSDCLYRAVKDRSGTGT